MSQTHTGLLRDCEPRSVVSWMAVRMVVACGFRKVTPVTALMDTPWTCPAWPALVRELECSITTKKKKLKKKKSNWVLMSGLSPYVRRCEWMLRTKQPDVVMQECKVHQHSWVLSVCVPSWLHCLWQTQLLCGGGDRPHVSPSTVSTDTHYRERQEAPRTDSYEYT